MGFIDLFLVALMPVLKVLLITGLGSLLALERVNILGDIARKHLNAIVFYVFNPSLIGSSLGSTITLDSFVTVWFMPFNILIIFLIGSALGWILVKVTGAPQHIKGLIIGVCSAGNIGNLLLVVVPELCTQKGSPFGDSDVCPTYALAYVSLSLAIGAIYLWLYVYNIIRISSTSSQIAENHTNGVNSTDYISSDEESLNSNLEAPLLPSNDCDQQQQPVVHNPTLLLQYFSRIGNGVREFTGKMNLKALLAPSTIAAIIGFVIGMVPPIRNLLVGDEAPLRVILSSASLIGNGAIPTVTLIVGGNLLKGLNSPAIQPWIIVGIVVIRYIFLPLVGIMVVRSVVRIGLVSSDPLYRFVLLIQYAVPPAMNIGTIRQLFDCGQSECSVIMLWTYSLALVSLTLWSTYFLWLVSI